MKALVWDDLVDGADIHYFERLASTFEERGVQMEIVQDWEEFEARFTKSDYAFVLVDCFDERGNLVGPERAKKIREIVSSCAARRLDPDFPIFLISSDIGKVPLRDWDQIAAVPLHKQNPINEAGRIIKHLDLRGRWTHSRKVFVIRQQSGTPMSPTLASDFRRLNGLIQACDLSPIPVQIGDSVDHVAIRQISAGIRAAEKIVVVLSKDDSFDDSIVRVARPNVYVELGYLILAFDGMFIEKALFCVQRGVKMPFEMNEIKPLVFIDSLDELTEDIETFLAAPENARVGTR